MAYQMPNGSFSLFPNDKKTKDNQPDWKGSIKLPDGQEYWFDAWNKPPKEGRAGFISGKIGNPKNQGWSQGGGSLPQPGNWTAPKTDDEDIPF